MENNSNKTSKQIRNLLAFILIITCLIITKICMQLILPLVLALFLFIFFSPLFSKFEKAHFPNWLSIIIILLLVIALMVVFFWFVFYSANTLIARLPFYSERLSLLDHMISGLISRLVDEPSETFSIFSSIEIDWIHQVILPALSSLSTYAMDILKTVLMMILYLFFLFLERPLIYRKLEEILEAGKYENVTMMITRINRQVSRYISLKSTISFATGILFYLTCQVFHLEFALLFGFLAFILNFIPTLGSIFCTLLVIIIAVLQFLPAWNLIITIAVLLILIQTILGNVIDPKLQGSQLNLSPFIILVSLTLFGYLLGIVGMFLAVPMMSIIQIILVNMEDTKRIAIMFAGGSCIRKASKRKNKKKNSNCTDRFNDFELPE